MIDFFSSEHIDELDLCIEKLREIYFLGILAKEYSSEIFDDEMINVKDKDCSDLLFKCMISVINKLEKISEQLWEDKITAKAEFLK